MKTPYALLLSTFLLLSIAFNANAIAPESATAHTTVYQPDTAAPDTQGILVAIPKTNCEIRVWYNYQVVAISKINAHWLERGYDLKTRAHKAFELRHNARINARYMMANPLEGKKLQAYDQNKYGNPDGPTFEYLMKKAMKDGGTEADAYQSIIDSSSRVSKVYNSQCL